MLCCVWSFFSGENENFAVFQIVRLCFGFLQISMRMTDFNTPNEEGKKLSLLE